MPVETITVQYVNEPRGKAISGSVKDTNGAYYGIKWPDWEKEFVPGNTYQIEYVQKGQFRNITRYRMVGEPQKAPPQGQGGAHRPDVSPDVARRMFIGAAMHGFMANPSVNVAHLSPALVANVISALEKGYDLHYSPKEQPRQEQPAPRDDMNDEIPWR